jgi:hypothetical protein
VTVHDDIEPEEGVVMAMLARRAGMTEGQLYTAVIAVLVVVVLTLTGLPAAHDLADPTGVVTVPAPPSSVAAP